MKPTRNTHDIRDSEDVYQTMMIWTTAEAVQPRKADWALRTTKVVFSRLGY